MRWLILAIALLLVPSCAQEEFELSSLSLSIEREAEISPDGEKESSALFIEASVSLPDDAYTFRIVSPDGDLSWEGQLEGSGSDRRSEAILLTPGARFPLGSYSMIIYSSAGTEVETEATLQYDATLRSFVSGRLSGDAYVSEYGEDGTIIAEGERRRGYAIGGDAASADISYTDSRGNSVSIRQSFRPSP